MRYICTNCGYIYDEKNGDIEHHITPDTPFSGLPIDWICPVCYVGKKQFDCLD